MNIQFLLAFFLSVMLSPADVSQVDYQIGDLSVRAVRGEENRWTIYEVDEQGEQQKMTTFGLEDGVVTVMRGGDHEHEIQMQTFLVFDADTDWNAIEEIRFQNPQQQGEPIQITRKAETIELVQDPAVALTLPLIIQQPQASK